MTVWDNIYKNYKNGGDAWATLSEEIGLNFRQFLNQTRFEKKHVLDIGCGIGKYLKLLQSVGFKTDGIDSSETAVEMTREVLNDDSSILCVDMFDFEIPKNKYDLIISISAIHHGRKSQVERLINRIYESIMDNGNVFITLPDFESSKKWNTFKNHEEIEEGTFSPLSGPERGLPHSFYNKEEIEKLCLKFKNLKLRLDKIGRWFITASK